MTHYDIFNGDADGICALHQLRLANPLTAKLVTGLKRDIQLFKYVNAVKGDSITALDISFDKNRKEVLSAIESGISIEYFDHHYTGDLPEANFLTTHIDTSPNVCTSLIVNGFLNGLHSDWGVVGAFGDNLDESAIALANKTNISANILASYKKLGVCINYNGYGFNLEDLIYHPKELFIHISNYKSPFELINESTYYKKLAIAYSEDIYKGSNIKPETNNTKSAIYFLPDEAWAKRVVGVLANQLARNNPSKAHALLIPHMDSCGESYRVSVRAPLEKMTGADYVCRQFKSGGGRKAAAGINSLSVDEYSRFADVFLSYYKSN